MVAKVSLKSRKKSFLVILAAGLVVCIVIAALELAGVTHIFKKQSVPATIPVKNSKSSSSSKKQSSSASTSSTGATPSETSSKVQSSNGGVSNSTADLVQPFGTLVSNHYPGQHGTNTSEQSACNTTPGANCYIQFTNTSSGAVTKLPTQTVGNDGATTWLWDANILTSGKWEVKAIASLNGQSKSVTDSIKLEVQ